MVKVRYWQWGQLVTHDEVFDSVDEAASYLRAHGVPTYAGEVRDFAPDAILDGASVITGAALDRLLDD